ncbi:MAG TPA: hypothetical protein VGB18_04410, partial [Candidatus Thermoplasmatota archaeon]
MKEAYYCQLLHELTGPDDTVGESTSPTVQEEQEDCRGEIDVQTDLNGNSWTCEGSCFGNIVIQVALFGPNEFQCDGDCVGNVQVSITLDDARMCWVEDVVGG